MRIFEYNILVGLFYIFIFFLFRGKVWEGLGLGVCYRYSLCIWRLELWGMVESKV